MHADNVLLLSYHTGVDVVVVLGNTDAACPTIFFVSGTRNPCLQALSVGLADTSVKLVHPPAVYQRTSQQAQRLQVHHFLNILSANVLCEFDI